MGAYKHTSWERQPGAEAATRRWLAEGLTLNPEGAAFGARLLADSGVRLRDIIDHVEFTGDRTREHSEAEGWREAEPGVWRNPTGLFPAHVLGARDCVWLRVESVAGFARAHGLELAVDGGEGGPMRRAVVWPGRGLAVGVIERNGYAGFDVPAADAAEVRAARVHGNAFRARRREFDDVEAGLAHTEALVDAAVGALGADRACHLWLVAEREYWMRRCAAGRLQYARQCAVGIGWTNIDHHTYDGSRAHFRHTVRVLETLGYRRREMLYAGELAGWGSQVLEQPAIGSTIFADVDLAPEELSVDFAHEGLPPLARHRRAGLLSALLGESILEAGLNHVAALYDNRAMRAQMGEHGVGMMAPFTDWPHLYQELTLGDWAAVDPARVDALEAAGHIGAGEAERLRLEGSIVTHLENIERNDGYKGFNREGIDGVLRKLDPRAYLAAEAAVAA